MDNLEQFRFKIKNKVYKPVIIGGMRVDISTPELALVAARLGGVGHISDAMSPFVSDSRFGTTYQKENTVLDDQPFPDYRQEVIRYFKWIQEDIPE